MVYKRSYNQIIEIYSKIVVAYIAVTSHLKQYKLYDVSIITCVTLKFSTLSFKVTSILISIIFSCFINLLILYSITKRKIMKGMRDNNVLMAVIIL